MAYTDFLDLAKARYSVRKFLDKKVPKDIIEKILKARIIVVESAEGLAKIKECTRCHFDAPLVFIISYNKEECWTRPYDGKLSGDIDASIVTTHMMLEAANLGIGSCWVMHYRPEVLKEKFNLPDNLESTALLVMGYPAEDAKPAPGHDKCRPDSELISWE